MKTGKPRDCASFLQICEEKGPVHDIGVGNIFIFETEPSGTAPLVDVIIFHDYSATRKRMRMIYDMAVELGKKYNKPILNNETPVFAGNLRYDHNGKRVWYRWYLFELMIGNDGWNKAHGIVYPDGTIRDPLPLPHYLVSIETERRRQSGLMLTRKTMLLIF